MKFNINNSDVVQHVNRLEMIHRSAMPVTVRKTLNDVAFAGRKQALIEFSNNFTERKKTFASSHIIFLRSPNTFDINQMVSSVGVAKNKSGAGNRLDKQEFGGSISQRKKIPDTNVRIGKSENKLVSKRFFFNKYKNHKRGVISRTKQRTVVKTKDTVLIFRKNKPTQILYRINRNVKINKAPFMYPATKQAFGSMKELFIRNAEKRILREWK